MAEQRLDREQVGAVFIKMGPECMTEGMAGKFFLPAEASFMGMDMAGKIKGIDRLVFAGLLREKPVSGFPISKPVLPQEVKGAL